MVVDLQGKLLPVIAGRECVVRNSLLLMRLAEILELLGRSDSDALRKMLPHLKA